MAEGIEITRALHKARQQCRLRERNVAQFLTEEKARALAETVDAVGSLPPEVNLVDIGLEYLLL